MPPTDPLETREMFLQKLASQKNIIDYNISIFQAEHGQLLLHYLYYQSHLSDKQLHNLFTTLSYSEITDHLQGGFFNLKNNLQKTLLNNAQLISLLTKASGHFFEGVFSVPAINSCQWIINHLQSEQGAFYKGMNAENKSNTYYAINLNSISEILDKDSYTAFVSAYNLLSIDKTAPIMKLKRVRTYQQIADHSLMHIKQVPLALESAHQQLSLARQRADLPEINTNVDIDDNCKMISALFNATRQFNRDDFASSAFKALEDIQQNFWNQNTKKAKDYLLMIHTLIKRLQYQWHDPDYLLLLRIANQFVANEKNSAATIVHEMINCHFHCSIDDFYNLYFLSSDRRFLDIAKSAATEAISVINSNLENYPELLITIMNYQNSQNFIVIRGSNFESVFWQQQLMSGFKPSSHIYAIANNCTGPDTLKFPVSEQTEATVYHTDAHQNFFQENDNKTYHSLDHLLKDFP